MDFVTRVLILARVLYFWARVKYFWARVKYFWAWV